MLKFLLVTNDRPELSIVIPVYEGEDLMKENLPILNHFLKMLPVTSQVLVVDDGSENPNILRKVAEGNGAVFLANPQNKGKGAAVRLGMLAAKGQVRLFTDADLPYKLDAISRAYDLATRGKSDVVLGDRTLAESHYYELIPMSRGVTSRIFSWVVRLLFLRNAYDTQCGFKAFSAQAAEEIFSRTRIDRFAMDVEVLAIAERRGFSIGRLPVQLRNWQGSGIKLLRDGLTMFFDLLRIRYFLAVGAYK